MDIRPVVLQYTGSLGRGRMFQYLDHGRGVGLLRSLRTQCGWAYLVFYGGLCVLTVDGCIRTGKCGLAGASSENEWL